MSKVNPKYNLDIDIDKEMIQAKQFIIENFFGYSAIAMPLKLNGDNSLPYLMGTDGKEIKYNPDKVYEIFNTNGLGEAQLRIRVIVLHEIYHVLMLHHTRRKDLDPKGWNIATDMNINSRLITELDNCSHFKVGGYRIQKLFEDMGAIWDKHGHYKGLSAEQIFHALYKEKDDDGNTEYQDKDEDGNPTGDNLDPDEFGGGVEDFPQQDGDVEGEGGNNTSQEESKGGDEGDGDNPIPQSYDDALEEEEDRIKKAITSADIVQKKIGDSGGFDSISDARDNLAKPISWLELLRDFFTSTLKGDENTWRRYSRRHQAFGLYLPSKKPQQSGVLAVGIDISGSVSQEERESFVKNIEQICSEFPSIKTIKICYINQKVVNLRDRHSIDSWDDDKDVNLDDYWDVFKTDENEEVDVQTLSGGGTRVDPFFNLIEQTDHEDYPDIAIYFTDGYCDTYREDNPPEFPVVWASTGTLSSCPDFAQGIMVNDA